MALLLCIDLFMLLFISLANSSNLRMFEREGPSPALERFLKVGLGPYKTISQSVNTVQERMEAFWPMGIVSYYVDLESYDYQVSRRLRIVMNMLETYTCIKFKPLLVKPTENMSWLHFTNPKHKRECSHAPEYHANGTIVMVLGLECLRRQNIIHTLLHAIGLKDEISHPQRDQYVRVLWENINPAYRNLFRIQTDDSSTKNMVEYDPISIMHFHDRAFSANGHATIAPLIPGLVINPSPDLSQLDKLKLRLLFNHECNKRRVDSLLDKCKNVMRAESSADANITDSASREEKGNSSVEHDHKDVNDVTESGYKASMCTAKSIDEVEAVTKRAGGTDEGKTNLESGEKTSVNEKLVQNYEGNDSEKITNINSQQVDVTNGPQKDNPEAGDAATVTNGPEKAGNKPKIINSELEVSDAIKNSDGTEEERSDPETIKSAPEEVGNGL